MSQKQVSFQSYSDFVEAITSPTSNNTNLLIDRISDLQARNPDINISLMITNGLGLPGESAEAAEIVKKVLFHGKELTDEVKTHMHKELGDIIWYWINMCRAMNFDPNDVIEKNVNKLESRYPGGSFSIAYSENRKEGDI